MAYYSSQESLLCLEKNGCQDLRQEMLMRDEKNSTEHCLKLKRESQNGTNLMYNGHLKLAVFS